MYEAKYESLNQRESSESVDSKTLLIDKNNSKSRQLWKILATLLIVLSITLNLVAYLPFEKLQYSAPRTFTVPYESRIPVSIAHDERSLYDGVWDEPRYNYTAGLIVADDTYIRKYNLPEAQKWPWDTSKSIYMLQGWHSMHCVMVLRDALIHIDRGTPLPFEFDHFVHCLHVLREDVACFADDTPLYTGAFHAETGKPVADPGIGQTRMCRDWDAIRQYGIEHSACYDAIAGGLEGPEIDKYKFCPDGSKPWQ